MLETKTPAWKRLGLKLKYANEVSAKPEETSRSTSLSNTNGGAANGITASHEPAKKKRKLENSVVTVGTLDLNNDKSASTEIGQRSKAAKIEKKRVSFSADTKSDSIRTTGLASESESTADDTLSPAKKLPKRKKSSKQTKQTKQTVAGKSHTALEYLNQYHKARSSWKFNKNREIWLLKHALSEKDIPQTYNLALTRYIRGLQGTATRERLEGQCREALKKSRDIGAEKDASTSAEDINFLQELDRAVLENPNLEEGNDQKQETDSDFQGRLQNLPRANVLLWALGQDTSATGMRDSRSLEQGESDNMNGAANSTRPKAKKKKNRTAVVEYSSSSSSESDGSESDTSSSDSSTSSDDES